MIAALDAPDRSDRGGSGEHAVAEHRQPMRIALRHAVNPPTPPTHIVDCA
jgi:hypothetical protein